MTHPVTCKECGGKFESDFPSNNYICDECAEEIDQAEEEESEDDC